MKKYILITGSNGLVGSESAKFFLKKKFYSLGIDNNQRKKTIWKNSRYYLGKAKLKKRK